MDPISAVGVAAGAIQFSDASFKIILNTIKLLQALHDTPKEVVDLLNDVDKSIIRLINLETRLEQPNDAIIRKLSTAQLHVLKETVSEGCYGVRQLQEILLGLKTSPADSRRKKAWKAVVSVHSSEKIERNLKKIQRYHSEIERQLQLTGLEFIADQSQQIENVQRAVDAAKAEAQTANSGIGLLTTDVQAHTTNIASRLEQLKLDNRATTASILSEQWATKDAIEEKSVAMMARLNSLASQGQVIQANISHVQESVQDSSKSIRDLMLNEFQLQRQREANTALQLKSFCDEMLSLMSSQANCAISIQSQAISHRITEEENKELNRQVSKALVRNPQVLRKSCDNLARRLNTPAPLKSFFDDQGLCSCYQTRTERWSRSSGIFNFRHQSIETHQPSCPLYSVDVRSWEYSFSLQILPFLRKTVEFTIGAAFQGGSCSIAPPLKIWGVVKRSESPLFRLFDDFLEECVVEVVHHQDYPLLRKLSTDKHEFTLDINLVKRQFKRLRDRIMDLTSIGISPWRTRDEFGNTLLHEVIHLMFIFKVYMKYFSIDLEPVLELAIKGGIDASCVANWGGRRYNARIAFDSKILDGYNALQQAASLMYYNLEYFANAPIIQDLMDLGFEDVALDRNITFVKNTTTYHRLFYQDGYIDFFQRYPQFTEGFDDGMLFAVASRDIDKVNKILRNVKHKEWQCCKYATHSFRENCALELAVGWPDGLHALLLAGANLYHAILLSVKRGDAVSLRVLLSAIDINRTDAHPYLGAILDIVQWGDDEIWQCVFNHLNEAPNYVRTYLLKHLYKWICLCNSILPISNVLGFLDKTWEAGFRRVDACGKNGLTPLYLLTSGQSWVVAREEGQVVHWFLKRGADPSFQGPDFPNILHSLAGYLSKEMNHQWEEVLPSLSISCDLSEADSCMCPCSSKGCLPLHRLLRCEVSHSLYDCLDDTQQDKDDKVSRWLRACNASAEQRELYYREAVRLEVFIRLDMTHTCCICQEVMDPESGIYYYARKKPDIDTCVDIQLEESELVLQLDLILEAFVQRRMHTGPTNEDNFAEWWRLLEPILPELKPYRRCLKHKSGTQHALIGSSDREYDWESRESIALSGELVGVYQLDWGPRNDLADSCDNNEGVRDDTESSRAHLCEQEQHETGLDAGEDTKYSQECTDVSGLNFDQGHEDIHAEYEGLDFIDVILAHFSKILGKGWADEFLREEQKSLGS